MSVHYSDDAVTVLHGDSLDILATLPDASVDSVVTDPPYGLEFMGKGWDAPWEERDVNADAGFHGGGVSATRNAPSFTGSTNPKCLTCKGTRRGRRDGTAKVAVCLCPDGGRFPNVRAVEMRAFQDWCEQWATECLRVLKPGGHMLAFGGSRTWHRLACAVEDAGFEVRDSIAWLYSQGFPKSMNPGRDQRFCQGCEVESEHGDDDLRGVRTAVSDLAAHAASGEVADVLASVQRAGAGSSVGDLRAPRADRQGHATSGHVRGGEPGMEGRSDLQAGEGQLRGTALREVPAGPAVHGEVGRLRDGAPASHGPQDRATAAEVGSGEPHQPRPTGQPTGEPGVVPEQRGPQAGRGGPVCAGCGKPPAPVGLGTALKPGFEPIVVARKPLTGTVAANVLAHGTGALNIDVCRVEAKPGDYDHPGNDNHTPTRDLYEGGTGDNGRQRPPHAAGRWPTNVVLDDTTAADLDEQTGELTSGKMRAGTRPKGERNTYGQDAAEGYETGRDTPGDSGGASRFFPVFRYEAKADTAERPRVNGIAHPTVKPLALMRWLVRLVTPPGGTILDPFAGSGTTVEACLIEGFNVIAIEREADYLPLIEARIARRTNATRALELAGEDMGLLGLIDGEATA